MSGTFLGEPPESDGARRLYDEDLAGVGYVMNLSRLWAYAPGVREGLVRVLGELAEAYGLGLRERGILIAACASTLGDAYCSLAWGGRLAGLAGEDVAAAVLAGTDEGLTDAERAMARWARAVARDPNGTTAADVTELREAGFADDRIFGITAFLAFRLAFSTVNDALGASPDAAYRTAAPPAVRAAVTYGRPIDDT